MKDKIVESVRAKLLSRSNIGIKKYNTTLDNSQDGVRGFINHFQQECMDGANYAEWLLENIPFFKPAEYVIGQCLGYNMEHETWHLGSFINHDHYNTPQSNFISAFSGGMIKVHAYISLNDLKKLL